MSLWCARNEKKLGLTPHPGGGRFWSRLLSSCTELGSLLVCLNAPSDLWRMQQPGEPSHARHRSSALCTSYWWLLETNSRHWYFHPGHGQTRHPNWPLCFATPQWLSVAGRKIGLLCPSLSFVDVSIHPDLLIKTFCNSVTRLPPSLLTDSFFALATTRCPWQENVTMGYFSHLNK